MFKTKLLIVLLVILFLTILVLSYFRFLHKGENFVNPVFESTGNLISDRGEYEGRAGFFSYFPFMREYNTYLNNTMSQRPCVTDSECNTGNCSEYGYFSAQYKNNAPQWRGNDNM